MRSGNPLRLALPLFLCILCAAPAVALDTIYLVRHAEKVDDWPADFDALRPLSCAGVTRAEALAERLKDAGIAAAYTSRTTRTIATAMPLVVRLKIPVHPDVATVQIDQMKAFLARLEHDHASDKAVLIVGHSNTVPQLLVHLGATPECFQRLGIVKEADDLEIEGYEWVWKVDLKKQGCSAIARE
jgi:broad specificity phosphatase PhoE